MRRAQTEQATYEATMAIVTSDGATLRAFADSVLRVAEDSAEEVVPVVLAVIGGILSEAEPGSVELQDAEGGALLWATFGGHRTLFRYNAMTAMIELRSGQNDRNPSRLFGRRSLAMDVVNFFGTLRAERQTRSEA